MCRGKLGSLSRCAFICLFSIFQVDDHYAEQARIKWMMSLGEELGGPERAKAMINAQGVSLILKSIEVQYKRIVTYPDTVRPFFLSPLPFNQTTRTSS